MYNDYKIGDLVLAKNRQTIFDFANNPSSDLEGTVLDDKMGLGVVVDYNPLFMQGHLKVWWSKAQKFTREDIDSLKKLT